MYNREIIGQLVDFISSKDGRTDKSRLQNEVQEAFGLVKDRSVYYCDWFAIRFCKAASRSFGGPVKIYAQNYLQARLSEVNRQ